MVIPSRRTSFWEKEVGEKCEEDVYHTAPDYFVLIEVIQVNGLRSYIIISACICILDGEGECSYRETNITSSMYNFQGHHITHPYLFLPLDPPFLPTSYMIYLRSLPS